MDADVTVIPLTYWPLSWKLEEAPTVGGVGRVSVAKRSVELIAISLHTENGPEKSVTLYAYVMSNVPPLLGQDALSQLRVRATNLP